MSMDREALAEDTLQRYCLPLVSKVREEDPEDWGPWLAAIPADRLQITAILLAALVPVDEPVSRLAGWARYRALIEGGAA
jgi:membrane protein YqaA with SNARE-associated domain